jgi:hypothetical protein
MLLGYKCSALARCLKRMSNVWIHLYTMSILRSGGDNDLGVGRIKKCRSWAVDAISSRFLGAQASSLMEANKARRFNDLDVQSGSKTAIIRAAAGTVLSHILERTRSRPDVLGVFC